MSYVDEVTKKKRNRDFIPRVMGIDDAAHYTGVSRTNLYLAIEEGKLKKSHIGAKLVFLREHLDEFIDAVVSSEACSLRDTRAARAKAKEARENRKTAATANVVNMQATARTA